MSNSLGNGLVQRAACLPSAAEIRRVRFGVYGDRCYGVLSGVRMKRSAPNRKLALTTRFLGNSLSAVKLKSSQGACKAVRMAPRAVLSPATELAGKYNLDGNSELQIAIHTPTPGSVTRVEFQVSNGSNSLVLHWGAINQTRKDWILPSRRPNGTAVYKNRALRTQFAKSGPNSSLNIEIDDPEIQAIEFLIVDEKQNKWFKHNGQNFQVKLSRKDHQNVYSSTSKNLNVSPPEDLVQIQAFLRWERNGRQAYSPDKEKASLAIFFIFESYMGPFDDYTSYLHVGAPNKF